MYTSEEIEAAVSKIVRTSIRRPYGVAGNRKTNLTFNDTKDAAAGVFILFPNAIFYIALLAARQLMEEVEDLTTLIADFTGAVRVVGRRVRPVKTTTSLANARVALDALSTALDERNAAFENIESIPAYQRFETNTQKFLTDTGDAVKKAGAIISTPTEARAQLATYFSSLQDSLQIVLDRVGYLTKCVEEFSGLNLPGLLSRSTISNARDVLTARLTELDKLTPEERLGILRDVTLDVLAARATVRGFGGFSTHNTFLILTGSGGPFASSELPATAASITTKHGPFRIVPQINGVGGDQLNFVVDGDSLSVTLLGSYVAQLNGTVKGPYDIGNPNTDGIFNTNFTIGIRNYPTVGVTTLYPITLTSGATQSVSDVCADINTDISNTVPIIAEPYANPLKFVGNVDIDTTGVPQDARFTSVNPATDFTALNVVAGDQFVVRGGGAHFGKIYQVITVAPLFLDCDIIDNAPIVSDELNKAIELGGSLGVRLRITSGFDAPRPEYRLQALQDRVSLFFPNIEAQRDAFYTFGFFPLMSTTSRPTAAVDLVRGFRASSTTSLGGSARVDASATFDPYLYVGAGQTNPANPSLITITELLSVPPDTTLRISGGTLNDGLYTVRSASGMDLEIIPALAFTNDVGNQPLFFTAELGLYEVAFTSLDTSLDTSLSVPTGSALLELFSSPPAAPGFTSFFQLPEVPKGLELGDVLELYTTQFDAPSFAAAIVGIDSSAGVVTLEEALPTTAPAFSFTLNTPLPFARIRKARLNTFNELRDGLLELQQQAWAKTPALHELSRVLQILAASSNPNLAQVGDVVAQLESYNTGLGDLQDILQAYTAEIVPPVDALLVSLQEKASERSLDLLLQARVATFFGLSQDQMSYAGSVEEAIRDVQKNDLPIRRTDRQGPGLAAMMTIASFEDSNPEYDLSDVDTHVEPDIPGSQGIPFPGQYY